MSNSTAGRKFSRRNQPVECRCCGKITHMECGSIVGIDLCPACLEQSELENSCSDNCHTEINSEIRKCPDHGARWIALEAIIAGQKAKAAGRVQKASVRVNARMQSQVERAQAELDAFDAKRRCANCCEALTGTKQTHCSECRYLMSEGAADSAECLARVAAGGKADYEHKRASLVRFVAQLSKRKAA